jgi:outer membrane receptor protein involved in Fe transport
MRGAGASLPYMPVLFPRLLTFVVIGWAFVGGFAHAAQPVHFDLPSANAEDSLRSYTRQAGTQVLFASEIVEVVRTNAVKGEFTPLEAARRLLAGTQLQATSDEKTGVLSVKRVDPESEGKNGPRVAPTRSDRPEGNRAAAARDSSEERVVLSPFEVNTSRDMGYQAQDTLSGSRFNTRLKDTAAPISVFTPEFLADIGATKLGDVAEWAVGAKIYYNEDEGNQNDLLFNPTIIKVRGQLSSTGRNYYEWVLSVDNFNSERLELSSGPNSILFGIGSPGGIFNTQTKRAQTSRTFANVSNRLGSNRSVRTTLDLNQVVVKDRLAFRVNVLREESDTWRKWEFDNAFREHVTLTWKPARATTVRFEGEAGVHHTLRSRTYATGVISQPWLAARTAGLTAAFQPGWIAEPYAADGTGNTGTFVRYAGATALPNTIAQKANAYIVYNNDTGELMNLRGATLTRSPFSRRASFHDPYVPDTAVIQGPTVDQIEHPKAVTIAVEQELFDNLYLELGYNRQNALYVFNDWTFSMDGVYVDTTSRMPNGSLNPNAGRPFMESSPVLRTRGDNRDTYRALVSYELDLSQRGKWLESHRFAAQYEHDNIAGRLRNSTLVVVDRTGAGFNAASAQNADNHVWYRNYVDFTRPDTLFWSGYRELTAVPIAQGQFNGQRVSTEWTDIAALNSTDRRKSAMAVMQNHWFHGRLITGLGIRREQLAETNTALVRNAAGATGWRMMLNVSRNEIVGASAGEELVAYLAAKGPTLYQNPSLLTSNGITVATEKSNNIDAFLLSNYLSRNGLAPRGQSKYSVNFRTNYSFTWRPLKGFSAGGGLQWRSAPVVGQTPGSAGDPRRVARYGRDYDTEFLNCGYGGRFRVGQKAVGYKVQLNVDNLFQHRGDYLITQVDTEGMPLMYRFREPRKYALTTTLDF